MVERLETVLAGSPVEVQSPEYIEGRNSGVRREVDVSLRGTVGSSPIFVMVECRDRESVQGVDWLEQVETKRDDVGADKAVVVSSGGFAGSVREYAQALGIEVRELSEVTAPNVFGWMGFEALDVTESHADIKAVSFQLASDSGEVTGVPAEVERTLTDSGMAGSAKVFRRKADGLPVSIADIWMALPKDVQRGRQELSAERREVGLNLNFRDLDQRYQIETNEGWRDIGRMEMVADVWADFKSIPVDKMFEYVDENGALAQSVQFAGYRHADKSHTFTLHVMPGKSVAVVELREEDVTELGPTGVVHGSEGDDAD